MNVKMIRYLLGIILLIEAGLLLFPLLVALLYGESIRPFLITIGILILISVPFIILKPQNTQIYTKEGFICVAGAWLLMSVFGAIPFVASGTIPNFISAFFETASGFTTTGASILTEIESLPKSILFWRSFTHWIGGMGVLVFMLAILPLAGGQTMYLMRAEVPGPTKGKLVPKMQNSALILYGIYVVMTVLLFFILLLCGMDAYHASVNAFATAGTGGFSVLNNSIAGYNNPAAEWVIAIFMLLFGINFNLYYFMIIKRWSEIRKNEELYTFLAICLISTVAIAANTWKLFENAGDCIRTAFFQVTTIISTCGFATADFNLWPALSQSILILLMLTGSCAGSTAGGLKISRVILICKGTLREIRHVLRPKSVNVVRLDGEPVEEDVVRSAIGYLALYLLLLVFTTFIISIDGYSLETNLTATIACLNNIGPGLKEVGPTGNFSGYSLFSQFLLALNMLFGRLEIMPMMILFSPFTWKKIREQKKLARKRKLNQLKKQDLKSDETIPKKYW
ncbi:MAG: TrkH family potassium uptake protein [Clostridia bacterium]|nr:TrkH family potassium uptake protein [Clostridia bacterium]